MRAVYRAEDLESRRSITTAPKMKLGHWTLLNKGNFRHSGKTLGVKSFCKYLSLSKITSKRRHLTPGKTQCRNGKVLPYGSSQQPSHSHTNYHSTTETYEETVPCDFWQCMKDYWSLNSAYMCVCIYHENKN